MNIGGIFIHTHCSMEGFELYLLRQTVEHTVVTETVYFTKKSFFFLEKQNYQEFKGKVFVLVD